MRILPRINGSKISYLVRIDVKGDVIEEKGEHLDLSKPQNVVELEKSLSQSIAKQVNQALKKSQNFFEVDYLGLGKTLNKEDPKFFKELDWSEVFPLVPVNVTVETTINTFGLAK